MERIWHPWHKWECFKAGFYATTCEVSSDEAKGRYSDFLADLPRFNAALVRVLDEWPMSCEQFLSNEGINRIAWLGQASMCIETGIPACFRGGFKLLSSDEQIAANSAAAGALERWLERMKGQRSTLSNGSGEVIPMTYRTPFQMSLCD